MNLHINDTVQRKKDHINLTLKENVSFIAKTTGFENYDFVHNAVTEVEFDKIELSLKFLNKKISFPFLISCMTGGTLEAESINSILAEAANELNVAVGVGSQRQAIENDQFHKSYKIIREKAGNVPVLGNLGSAQIASLSNFSTIQKIVDLIEADAMVVHFNPLQELLQEEGDKNFKGILSKLKKLVKYLPVPVITKEVGAGISREAALKLLECGVSGIDVAGAGGTSWAGIEILRSKEKQDNLFWDWGLPTAYCLREIKPLKRLFKFYLIGSGGIKNGFDIAKAIALGADITASARPLFIESVSGGPEGVKRIIVDWFETVKKIMYLTGANNLKQLQKIKLIRKVELM